MTDKELKKLSRKDLLYMLVSQGKELQELKEQYAKAEEALKNRTIQIEEAGSIAEAALKVNGVFEAAEEACRQYTENIAWLNRQQEALCVRREEESIEQAKQILEEAQRKSEFIKEETRLQCAEMIRQAEEEVKARKAAAADEQTDPLESSRELKANFLSRTDEKK